MQTRAIFVVTAFAALSVTSANAAVVGLDDAVARVPSGTSYSVTLDDGDSFSIANDFTYLKSDYYGLRYYGKSVSAAASGSVRLGYSAVAAGTLIGAAQTSMSSRLDSQTAFFNSVQVGTRSYSCGAFHLSTCYRPVYGDVGHSVVNNFAIGDQLYLPASYVDPTGILEFGYISLSIAYNGLNVPYTVSVNGYAFQTDGSAILAGQALTPVTSPMTPVPLPGSLALMGLSVLGLAGFRQARTGRKRPGEIAALLAD